jgi:hypothetical protein
VITIQTVMLVLLGFLIASLLALLIGPAHRARIVRLTTDELKQAMPLTEAEIRADKDRLRADYAIQLHKQSMIVDDLRTSASRQLIEINRRDANISRLESEADRLKAQLEETDNARNVLEQTVRDRLPRVESRLAEAKKLITQRDRDIAQLTMESEKTLRALNEAMQINAQQRSELSRMQALDVARGSTSTDSLADPMFNAEIALKSEIESLREQVRDQAALISRLQGALSGAAGALETSQVRAAAQHGASQSDGDVETMKHDLRALESGQRPATLNVPTGQPLDRDRVQLLEASVRQYRAKSQDQAAEIARLAASLKAYEEGEGEGRSGGIADSRMAMKVRVGALQGQLDVQTETIQKLRAEVASANERLARQSAHYVEELRKLGAGTLPAAGPSRRRVEQVVKRSLTDRLNDPGSAEQPNLSPPANANSANSSMMQRLKGLGDADGATAVAEREPTTEPARAGQKPRLLDRLADLGSTTGRGADTK